MTTMEYVELSGPYHSKMPIIGLGTWQAKPKEIETAVTTALDLGYRHIDTAFNYNNEEAIGKVIKKWIEDGKGTREDLFITTKLPHVGNRATDVELFLCESLKRLQLEYVDLYLIHLPFGFLYDKETLNPLVSPDGDYVLDTATDHISTWKELENQVDQHRIKNLGVSNFNACQLETVWRYAQKYKPAVLQVELHAYLQQKELRTLCKRLNIAVTAYSPLGSPGAKQHFITKYNYNPDKFPDILGHPKVVEIAAKYNKNPAQILLRHLIQQKIIAIPKSANPQRIKENKDVFDFELTPEELENLNSLDRGESGRIFNFFFWKGVDKHPQYPFVHTGDKMEN